METINQLEVDINAKTLYYKFEFQDKNKELLIQPITLKYQLATNRIDNSKNN